MPAPDSEEPPGGARAVVETLNLDGAPLTDRDLSELALPHSNDHYSADLDALVSISSDLDHFSVSEGSECLGGDTLAGEEIVIETTLLDDGPSNSPHNVTSILPDIIEENEDAVMHDLQVSADSGRVSVECLQSPQDHFPVLNDNVISNMLSSRSSQVSNSSIVVIQSPVSSGNVTSDEKSVTVNSNQILGQITGLPNSFGISSVGQFQALSQTLTTAKSEGNKVQLPLGTTKLTVGNLQTIRPTQTAIKRPATSNITAGTSGKNLFTKVIITGNAVKSKQNQAQITLSADSLTSGQPIKILNSSGQTTSILGNATKSISISQAQQMGILPQGKLQNLLSSPNKQNIIVNRVSTPPIKSPSKITMLPSVVKSPTKILPYPVTGSMKPVSISAIPGLTNSTATVKPLLSPQKVLMKQGTIKLGTVLAHSSGQGQIIRIPASQSLVSGQTNVTPFQVQGTKQLQFVRLVSGTNTGMITAKTNTTATTRPFPVALTSLSSQSTVKMVPIAPATPGVRAVLPKSASGQPSQRILIPASAPLQIQTAPGSAVTTLSGSNVQTLLQSRANNIIMLEPTYVQQNQQSVVSASTINVESQIKQEVELTTQVRTTAPPRTNVESNGLRTRKPCNCTKSQCLKLYCDCFANGEFCYKCNCNNCFNNLEHEEDRQRATKSCLERNPNAFRPKIGKAIVGDERRHNKGCNCKRSGCLKNYCECYEAKISCSHNCKCVGCRNVEESYEKRIFKNSKDFVEIQFENSTVTKTKLADNVQEIKPVTNNHTSLRQSITFLTPEVLNASCQLLLAHAEEAEGENSTEEEMERRIIEAFGNVLIQIIETGRKAEQEYGGKWPDKIQIL